MTRRKASSSQKPQRHLGWSVPVNPTVQVPDKACHRDVECPADSQKFSYGNRSASLDLLPVSGREANADHVLLAEPMLLPQVADASAQCVEEFLLIDHP